MFYHAGFESSNSQASPGKMTLGLQVTDLQGYKLSFARAFARSISKIISRLIFFMDYIMAIFTVREQALHDIIASTLVVKRAK